METLAVTGAITNNSAFMAPFSLPVTAGGNAVWSGPLAFSANVSFGISQITLANAASFSGSAIEFNIVDAFTYGRFLGAGTATVTGVTLNIGSTYTGSSGDVFDLTSGNFSGATLGSLPALTGGLTWDTTNFLANGTLSVVPEPSSGMLLFLGAGMGLAMRRIRLATK